MISGLLIGALFGLAASYAIHRYQSKKKFKELKMKNHQYKFSEIRKEIHGLDEMISDAKEIHKLEKEKEEKEIYYKKIGAENGTLINFYTVIEKSDVLTQEVIGVFELKQEAVACIEKQKSDDEYVNQYYDFEIVKVPVYKKAEVKE